MIVAQTILITPIIAAIGGQPDVEPGLYSAKLKRGDWVLVCSDGLTTMIADEEIAAYNFMFQIINASYELHFARSRGLVDAADHVERLLGQVVVLAGDDGLEAADRVLERHVLAGAAGEHFGDVERLRQEALDLAGPGHGQLVFR